MQSKKKGDCKDFAKLGCCFYFKTKQKQNLIISYIHIQNKVSFSESKNLTKSQAFNSVAESLSSDHIGCFVT